MKIKVGKIEISVPDIESITSVRVDTKNGFLNINDKNDIALFYAEWNTNKFETAEEEVKIIKEEEKK